MRVWIKTAVCIGLAVAGTGAASADQGTAVAQAAGGGMAAGCVSVVDTRPDEEPAELYKMAKGCADANDFHRGVALALLARLRMRYDAERFKDKHAFWILYELQKEPKYQRYRAKSAEALQALTDFVRNKLLWSGFCMQLRNLPPPDYEPTYMLKRFKNAPASGMGDFLKTDLDPAATWQAVVKWGNCGLD